MQSIDGVCCQNIGMKRACEKMCVCVCVEMRYLIHSRVREARSEWSILGVFYLPLYRGADQKWVMSGEGGDLHVWWWYLPRHSSDPRFNGEESRMWKRGAQRPQGMWRWGNMTEVIEGGSSRDLTYRCHIETLHLWGPSNSLSALIL